MPSVAVVIPVFNDAVNLRACLEAIGRSDEDDIECIVVDDASRDSSAAVAREYGAAVVVLSDRSGPAAARNAGAAMATAPLLFFCDADVCVHPDAISRARRVLECDASLSAVIGSYDDSPAAPGLISQYRNLLHCYVHQTARREASTFWCGCGAVRRSVFLELGGFDASYRRPCVEDIEFGYRLRRAGGRIALDPAMKVQHRKRWRLASMIRCDVVDRAVPWTELIHRYRDLPNDLNVSTPQRASAALLLLGIAAAALGQFVVAAAFLVPVLWLNRRFYAFLRAKRGWLFAVGAVPLHLAYFVYSAAAFAFAAARWRLRGSRVSTVALSQR